MHTDLRRPKDSMKSTWRKDKSQWGFSHYFLTYADGFHMWDDKDVPVHQKNDPIPYMTQWSSHLYILAHAGWPIALQWAIMKYNGGRFPHIACFFFYALCMQLNSLHQLKIMRRLAHKVGFLDGDKHKRDEVPDTGVDKTLASLELTTTLRPLLAVFLSYRTSQPFSLSWWLPVELALYCIVLDGFFYLYHRSCHELDGLWKYHRTHHLTKHPNPLLSSYADSEQEFLELALIPVLAWATCKFVLGLPMGFHDWWVCHEYVIFIEAFGHSGLRFYSTSPNPASPILHYFDMDLTIEDHDLHHRKGWRSSHNYGKQTRVWDRLFGTAGARIEAIDTNIDLSNSFNMPLF